jgi:hypothetical protein
MTTVAVHQPNFLPWLGYFAKIAAADVFVVLDDVQFARRDYTNRVRLNSAAGPWWLTIPVQMRGGYLDPVSAIRVAGEPRWRERIVRRVSETYAGAPHRDLGVELLARALETPSERLAELNLAAIRAVLALLRIERTIVLSSELGAAGSGGEKILALVRAAGGDTYVSGAGGRDYQDERAFAAAGVAVRYLDAPPPPYRQVHGEFRAGLGVLDALLNAGAEGTAELVRVMSAS